MSEKKKFKVGEAVVNVCTMIPAVYEHAVAVSTRALKEEMTEMAAAAAIKKAMLAAFPADNWQVCRLFRAYGKPESSFDMIWSVTTSQYLLFHPLSLPSSPGLCW